MSFYVKSFLVRQVLTVFIFSFLIFKPTESFATHCLAQWNQYTEISKQIAEHYGKALKTSSYTDQCQSGRKYLRSLQDMVTKYNSYPDSCFHDGSPKSVALAKLRQTVTDGLLHHKPYVDKQCAAGNKVNSAQVRYPELCGGIPTQSSKQVPTGIPGETITTTCQFIDNKCPHAVTVRVKISTANRPLSFSADGSQVTRVHCVDEPKRMMYLGAKRRPGG